MTLLAARLMKMSQTAQNRRKAENLFRALIPEMNLKGQ
jgi:hypothetical protein